MQFILSKYLKVLKEHPMSFYKNKYWKQLHHHSNKYCFSFLDLYHVSQVQPDEAVQLFHFLKLIYLYCGNVKKSYFIGFLINLKM